jgi:hypothetical protein
LSDGCGPGSDGLACDDGDPCSVDTTCNAGYCKGGVSICTCKTTADCAAKDDGNLCNGTEYCDTTSIPYTCKTVPQSVVNCPAATNSCEVSSCDPKTGQCAILPAASTKTCDDGDPCTDGDHCENGTCQPGEAVGCQCQNNADCLAKEDGNLCNGTLYCDKQEFPYACKVNPATVVQCTASTKPCEKAVCLAQTGKCSSEVLPDLTSCDDGKSCTSGDHCESGQCTGSAQTCTCATTADCLPYEDGDLCNGTLFCNKAKGQCQLNPATVVACATGLDTACKSTTCNKQSGQCESHDAKPNTPCSDDNVCTAGDTCQDGDCIAGPNTCGCNSDADCLVADDGNPCNGQLFCDLSTHSCLVNPTTIVQCPFVGNNPCAPVECNPQNGQCEASPKPGKLCDDGNPCTALGICVQNQCEAGVNICQCQSAADCQLFDDANVCNGVLYCDQQNGLCETNLAAIPPCPDGLDPCTDNTCDPSTGGCKSVAATDGTWCNDGEPCTKNDSCQTGSCTAGLTVCPCLKDADCASYDNGNLCDGRWFCNKNGGESQCVFNPASIVACSDEGLGTCQSIACIPETGECLITTATGTCDDGNVCTVGDACNGPNCLPGDATDCTDDYADSLDVCDPVAGCKHIWPEVCDGMDNDADGKVDNPKCGGGSCVCEGGTMVCPATCQTCPDPGDVAILIDDGGKAEVVCAHDYPAWGVVPETPNSIRDNGDGTAVDYRTGLQWAKALPPNQSDAVKLAAYCDTLNLAGHSDWRIPTLHEMLTTVHFKRPDNAGTPQILASTALVSSSPASTGKWWRLGADGALTAHDFGTNGSGSTRCVRHTLEASTTSSLSRYIKDNSAGVVSDQLTDLEWQLSPPITGGSGFTGVLTFQEALDYCDSLALGEHEDWRLPTVYELAAVLHLNASDSVYIDQSAFPATPIGSTSAYWTKTSRPAANGQVARWTAFLTGTSPLQNATTTARVRCVRQSLVENAQCGDQRCSAGETQTTCPTDCGCEQMVDGAFCSTGGVLAFEEHCKEQSCQSIAVDCKDGSTDTKGVWSGPEMLCQQVKLDICDGLDNDGDGTTDNVVCHGMPCECEGSVTTCVGSEVELVALSTTDWGKSTCAPNFAYWGVLPSPAPALVSKPDGILLDTATNLEWEAVPFAAKRTFKEAKDYCNALELGKRYDWRLPTRSEAISLFDFNSTQLPSLRLPLVAADWTSDTWLSDKYTSNPSRFRFNSLYLSESSSTSGSNERFVCVRAVSDTNNYPSSEVRLSASSDQITTYDNLTGLTWETEGSTSISVYGSAATRCDSLVIGGHDDWRLPTLGELFSLWGPNGWLIGPGKSYWSGTGPTNGGSYALVAEVGEVDWGENTTSYKHFVRCVR